MKNITFNFKIYLFVCTFFILGAICIYLVINQYYVFLFFFLLLFFYLLYKFILIINKSTSDLLFLLEALQNNDFGITFKLPSINDKILLKLYQNYNSYIEKNRDFRIKNEANALFYKQLIDKIPFPMVVFKEYGLIVFCNKQFLQLVGTSTINNLNDLNLRVDKIKHILLHQSQTRTSIEWDSKRNFMLQSNDFIVDGITNKMVSFLDVSLEMQQQELQSWTDLLKVLTHEIMNSITPITSLAGTALQLIQNDDSDLHLAISTIHKRANGLNTFIYSFRNLTKKIEPQVVACLVSDLYSEMKLYTSTTDLFDNITFEYQIDTISPTIFIDKSLIVSVLINLYVNAAEALYKTDYPKICITTTRKPYNKIEISVSDNGCGITKEALSKIFIPFFSTKKQGSGIGLSISKQIIQAHKAEICVSSTENMGSIFTIIF